MFKIACIFDSENKFNTDIKDNPLWEKALSKMNHFFNSEEINSIECKKCKENIYFFYNNEIEKDSMCFLSDCITVISTGDCQGLFSEIDNIEEIISAIKDYSIKNVQCQDFYDVFIIKLPQVNHELKVMNIDLEDLHFE